MYVCTFRLLTALPEAFILLKKSFQFIRIVGSSKQVLHLWIT